MNQYLFNKGSLDEVLNVIKQKLESEVQQQNDIKYIKNNEKIFFESLVEKYKINPPNLRLDVMYQRAPKHIKISGGRFYNSYLESRNIDGIEYTIIIPFNGDGALFNYRGDLSKMEKPRGEIIDNELILKYQLPSNHDIKAKYERDIDNIQVWLKGISNVANQYNKNLPNFVAECLSRQKKRLDDINQKVIATGIPIKNEIRSQNETAKELEEKEPIIERHSAQENLKDVFLCHASEDKKDYIIPFANALLKNGITFWLDEAEIRWGDKITEKINKGLKSSKFVIVFLSENFLRKKWTNAELGAALNKENSTGQTSVLPLILEKPDTITDEYPLLKDKKYLEWKDGISKIIDKLKSLLNG